MTIRSQNLSLRGGCVRGPVNLSKFGVSVTPPITHTTWPSIRVREE